MRLIRRKVSITFIVLFTLALVVSTGVGQATAEETFYTDKTLMLIVPYGAGGGTDTLARIVAPYIEKYLGDRATVQVVNRPGGGGINATNRYALQGSQGGTVAIFSSTSSVTPWVLSQDVVRYNYGDFTPIFGSVISRVIYVSPSTGIEQLSDARTPNERLVYGGQNAQGSIPHLIAFELLDLDVTSIFGFGSGGAARIAFERGETNLDAQSAPAYQANVEPLIEAGKAIPLFSLGVLRGGDVVRDPTFPDLPSTKDVYELFHGETPSGPMWNAYKAALGAQTVSKALWLHPDAPEEAVQNLLAAVTRMAADPDFQGRAQAEIGNNRLSIGDEVADVFSEIANMSDETRRVIDDVLANA